jgi:ribosomal protein S20
VKKTYRALLAEISQQHTSADTSLNQVSSGIAHATSSGLIKSHSTNVDVGGGKYDAENIT